MKGIKFPEVNLNLREPDNWDKEKYGPCDILPTYRDKESHIFYSCWKMTWRERFSALFFGKAWLSVLTMGSHPPVSLTTTRNIFTKPKKEKTVEP